MNQRIVLSSLAMDLERVALGLHRGSYKMAGRFLDEALKRKDEVNLSLVAPYIRKLLVKLDNSIKADDALMYSLLLRNYIFKQNFDDDSLVAR